MSASSREDIVVSELCKSRYPNTAWATFGNLQVVGNGIKRRSDCGDFKHLKGCLNVDLHNVVTLDGKDYRGKVYVRLVHECCFDFSCPICYKGAAMREARNVDRRVSEFVKLHGGIPEHVIVSVPPSDWGLSLKAMRRKAEVIAESCGVRGG